MLQCSGGQLGRVSIKQLFVRNDKNESIGKWIDWQCCKDTITPGLMMLQGSGLGRVTAAWQQGRINNLDYLLFCNLAAGRRPPLPLFVDNVMEFAGFRLSFIRGCLVVVQYQPCML